MTDEDIKYHNQLWYYRTYNRLIDKCIQMEKDGYPEDMYTEVHHILPKCLGGTNDESNLVRMPVRYHIMAHLLLMKIHPTKRKIIYAANIMIIGNKSTKIGRSLAIDKFSTRTISWVREENYKMRRGINSPNYGKHLSDETKKKISNSQKGKKISKSTREKLSKAGKGRKHTEQTKKKMSKTRLEKGVWNKGKHLSEETKRKLSLANKGKVITEDNRQKLILTNKGKHRSEETKRKISKANSGENNPFYKKSHSEEVKKKISEHNKGIIPKNAKPVMDPIGNIYSSIKKCSIAVNVPVTTLSRWIKEHPEKGYKFV